MISVRCTGAALCRLYGHLHPLYVVMLQHIPHGCAVLLLCSDSPYFMTVYFLFMVESLHLMVVSSHFMACFPSPHTSSFLSFTSWLLLPLFFTSLLISITFSHYSFMGV